MRRLAWTCALVVVAMLIGCGGGGGGATPRETFNKLKNALTDKKFDDVWSLLSTDSQKYYEDKAAQIAKKAGEVMKESEPQSRIALGNQAKIMEITVEKMKKLDGKTLVGALLTMAAKDGKDVWGTISRTKYGSEEISEDGRTAKVFVECDGVVQETKPILLVLEDEQWKVDLMTMLPEEKMTGASKP